MAIDCQTPNAKFIAEQVITTQAANWRVEHVTDLSPEDPLWTQWEELAGSRLFLAPRWLMPWWRAYRAPGSQLLLLTVRNAQDELIGLAPWFLQRTWLSGNKLQSLGCGLACTDYMSILTQPHKEEAVLSALAEYLKQRMPQIDHIYLEGIEADNLTMGRFAQIMATQYGYQSRDVECLDCFRLPLPADWETWVMQLSRSRRRRVRQLWRDQFDTGKAVIKVAHDENTLAEGFEILVDLHQRRQNAIGHPGSFASKAFYEFLWEAAQRHLASGQLRLQWVELEGKPVAAQLDLQEGDTLLDYCSGIAIDCEYARPGWLGVTAGIRHAIESGRTTFDFLRGDESYKSHWRAEPVKMIHLDLVPPTFKGRMLARLRATLGHAKALAKRLLRPTAKPEQSATNGEDDS
ncbi:GNAT family N-acetyltransferase [Bremerella cremea]|nr:GNAT family N-acetyltransferase [Bremerella cremea]